MKENMLKKKPEDGKTTHAQTGMTNVVKIVINNL